MVILCFIMNFRLTREIYNCYAYSSTELFTIGVIEESGAEAVVEDDNGALTVDNIPCITLNSNNSKNLISLSIFVVEKIQRNKISRYAPFSKLIFYSWINKHSISLLSQSVLRDDDE